MKRAHPFSYVICAVIGVIGSLSYVLAAPAPSPTPQPIAVVTQVKGNAWLNNGQKEQSKVAVQTGSSLRPGDLITTDKQSTVQIVVGNKDAALLLKAEGALSLSQSPSGKWVVDLIQGMSSFVVRPRTTSTGGQEPHFRVRSRGTDLAVRGTQFFVKTEPSEVYLCTCSGTMSVDNQVLIVGKNHDSPRRILTDQKLGSIGKRLKPGSKGSDHTDSEGEELSKLLGL